MPTSDRQFLAGPRRAVLVPMLMCVLALSCQGCPLFGELGWDLYLTVDIPLEVQMPYSAMRPGRVMQGTPTAPGFPLNVEFMLGVVCDPVAPIRQLILHDSAIGCVKTHDIVVWLEPFDPAELAVTPCDSKPRTWIGWDHPQVHLENATAQARKTVFQFQGACGEKDTVHLVLAPGRPF
jgi:hypothetical protein